MNADQDYGFDVAGFIVVPQVLSAELLQACNQAIDAVGRDEGMLEWPGSSGAAFRMLQEHPVLQEILAALCGPDYVLDGPPAIPNATGGYAMSNTMGCAFVTACGWCGRYRPRHQSKGA